MLSDAVAMATMPDDESVTLRQFAGTPSGGLSDQKWGDDDASVDNPTGRFIVIGPRGMSVEGQPYYVGGQAVSPLLMLLLIGAGAYLLLRR